MSKGSRNRSCNSKFWNSPYWSNRKMNDGDRIVISKTGEVHGKGSDPYKWVSGLTPEEMKMVKEGDTIVLIPTPLNEKGKLSQSQTPYKMVIYAYCRFTHRNYYGDVPPEAIRGFSQ